MQFVVHIYITHIYIYYSYIFIYIFLCKITNQLQIVYKAQFNRFRSKATGAPSHYVKHVQGNSYKCLCISVALPNREGGGGGELEKRGQLIENFYQLLLLRILWAFYLYAAWLNASCMLPDSQPAPSLLSICSLHAAMPTAGSSPYSWPAPAPAPALLCALLPVCFHACLPACALGLLPVSPTASLSAFTSVYPATPYTPILPQLPRGRQYLWQQCDQRVVGGVASGRITQFGVGVGVHVDVDGSGDGMGLDSIRFVASFPYLFTACSLPRHDVAVAATLIGKNIVAEVPHAPPLHGCHWQHT